MNPRDKAAAAIEKILQDLESETGRVVEEIDLTRIPYAEVGGPVIGLRSVRIRLSEIPGTNWFTQFGSVVEAT